MAYIIRLESASAPTDVVQHLFAVKLLSAIPTVDFPVLPCMIRTASASLNAASSLRALLRLPIAPSHPLSTTSSSTVSLERRQLPRDGGKSSPTSSQSIQPRSEDRRKPRRRLDPQSRTAQRTEAPRKPLLKPYALTQRLTRLCADGKLDEAVAHLQSMPLDAQNVSTWTTVISRLLQAERYQAAYRLYIDVCPWLHAT